MSRLVALMDTQASLELTTFAATWAAIVLVSLVAANLHVRLARLERGDGGPQRAPYGHLAGRRVDLRFAGRGPAEPGRRRVVLFVASDCRTCRSLLDELCDAPPPVPVAVAWTDRDEDPGRDRVPGLDAVANGARVSAELGIRVTPFALELEPDGTVARAAPVGTARSLARFAGAPDRPASATATA